jgi:hypothetical protein
MFVSILKRLVVIWILAVTTITATAQQNHFLYLQTETGQPFYVKLNNKLISSSSAGYMIIPALADGNYNLVVGFPKDQFPEETFEISIENNKGFLIKNFGEKGWGLFNMQSLAVIQGKNSNTDIATTQNTEIQSDAFSNMLADVVKDSSILRNHAEVSQSEKIKKDEISSVAEGSSPIKKILNEKDADGVQLVYVDNTETTDTVRIYIPAENQAAKPAEEKPASVLQEEPSPVPEENVVKTPTADTVRFTITPTIVYKDPEIITQEKDTIKIYKERDAKKQPEVKPSEKIESNNANPLITIIEPKTDKEAEKKVARPAEKESDIVVLPKVVTSSSVNSDCKSFADNSDFLKLRKKMASVNGRDDMIGEAKKVFKSKCFSTEQIRNLSYLFLTDEGKYMFLDAAYPFASDSDQYDTLVSQLSDDYYIKRFNAMIHK